MVDNWKDIVRILRSVSKHPYMDNSCKINVIDVMKAIDEIERLRVVQNLSLEAFGALKKVRATNVKGKPVDYKTLENIDSIIIELEYIFKLSADNG